MFTFNNFPGSVVHNQGIQNINKQSKNMDEEQYFDLVRRALASPTIREGRNGAKTRSVFGHMSRYSLVDGTLPLLTTKKMFTRGIIEELLWMLRGSTNVDELKQRRVHIWDGHSSREHLDKNPYTAHLREGDIGPGYGWQWRAAGAPYQGCDFPAAGGVDQIKQVFQSLKENPAGRRHVVCAWNAPAVEMMALPPCHCLFQFYVDENGLSCQMYQRSADIALGVPFNITSYSILTHLFAKMLGLPAHEFIHVIGDAHIYEPHERALAVQLTRPPLGFPTITINNVPDNVDGISNMTASDFVINGYTCHPPIKMDIVL